jgi:hypothetical protein
LQALPSSNGLFFTVVSPSNPSPAAISDEGAAGSILPLTFHITTNTAGQALAIASSAITIEFASLDNAGTTARQSGSASPTLTTPFTFITGTIIALVRPTINSNDEPIIILLVSTAYPITMNTAGQVAVVVASATLPLVPVSSGTGVAGYTTNINGCPVIVPPASTAYPITTNGAGQSVVVMPSTTPSLASVFPGPGGVGGYTTNSHGSPVIILPVPSTYAITTNTTGRSVVLVPSTTLAFASIASGTGVGGYIVAGLGGGAGGASSGSPVGGSPSGANVTGTSQRPPVQQVTTGLGSFFAVSLWAAAMAALLELVMIV